MDSPSGDVAVVMLACRDYEAMELSLACHMAYGDPGVPFYILQNCRGYYDAERTLEVAKRYADLYPSRIRLIARNFGIAPYNAILLALEDQLRNFRLICKVDDDAFPIAPGWLQQLRRAYDDAAASDRLAAYTTPLINNNTYGFSRVLDAMGLAAEYFDAVAMEHVVGAGPTRRIAPASEVVGGQNGTIWAQPHAARWLHERTSLRPDEFIAATRNLPDADMPSAERYSIGCLLFARTLWREISTGAADDELMMHQYCARGGARTICVSAVPFVHVAYWTQREANRDLVPRLRDLYEARLELRHPMALRTDHMLEIEARLRWQLPKQHWWRRFRRWVGRVLRIER